MTGSGPLRSDDGRTCPHQATEVVFPDGTVVHASGSALYWARPLDPPAEIGLYMDDAWGERGTVIDWPDGGIPRDEAAAAEAVRLTFQAAREGRRVEVGCVAGHGRTGTVLACMAVLAGVPADQAVAWVRRHYCVKAVEGERQEAWVRGFAERP